MTVADGTQHVHGIATFAGSEPHVTAEQVLLM
jgi:hypothetical protein